MSETNPTDDSAAASVDSLLEFRKAYYGEPNENLRRIALIWSGLIGVEIKPELVALMEAANKMYRATVSPDYGDNWDDIHGWTKMGEAYIEQAVGMVHARTVTEYFEKKQERDQKLGRGSVKVTPVGDKQPFDADTLDQVFQFLESKGLRGIIKILSLEFWGMWDDDEVDVSDLQGFDSIEVVAQCGSHLPHSAHRAPALPSGWCAGNRRIVEAQEAETVLAEPSALALDPLPWVETIGAQPRYAYRDGVMTRIFSPREGYEPNQGAYPTLPGR